MEKEIKDLKKESKTLFELQRVNQQRIDYLSEIVANNLIENLKSMKQEIKKLADKLK